MKITYLERSPGTWRLRVETGKDADGTRQFAYETVHGNEEAAQRRRFELLKQHEEGSFTRPDKLTVAGYLGSRDGELSFWVGQRLALGKIGRSSAENYQRMLDTYVVPTLGGKRLQKITANDVQALYASLLGRGLSRSTVSHVHRIVTAAMKSARKTRLVVVNVMEEVEGVTAPKSKPRALTQEQVGALLGAVAGDWKEPIVVTALLHGLRRGEVLGLRWADVELDRAKLHVRGQLIQYDDNSVEWVPQAKTEAGERVIDIPAEGVALLRALRREAAEGRLRAGIGGRLDDAFVFTKDGERYVRPDTLTGSFTALCRRLGLPERFSFHGVRHTWFTHLLRGVGKTGAKAVSEAGGHSDVVVTLRTYQTVFEEDRSALAGLAGSLLGKKSV